MCQLTVSMECITILNAPQVFAAGSVRNQEGGDGSSPLRFSIGARRRRRPPVQPCRFSGRELPGCDSKRWPAAGHLLLSQPGSSRPENRQGCTGGRRLRRAPIEKRSGLDPSPPSWFLTLPAANTCGAFKIVIYSIETVSWHIRFSQA